MTAFTLKYTFVTIKTGRVKEFHCGVRGLTRGFLNSYKHYFAGYLVYFSSPFSPFEFFFF